MEKEILKADLRLRKIVLGVLIVVMILGSIALAWFVPWLNSQIETMDTSVALKLLNRFVIGLLFPPVFFAAYMITFGIKSLRQGVFPPEGSRVIRDTVVYRGKAAKVKGIVLILMALALVTFCIYTMIFAYMMFSSLIVPSV